MFTKKHILKVLSYPEGLKWPWLFDHRYSGLEHPVKPVCKGKPHIPNPYFQLNQKYILIHRPIGNIQCISLAWLAESTEIWMWSSPVFQMVRLLLFLQAETTAERGKAWQPLARKTSPGVALWLFKMWFQGWYFPLCVFGRREGFQEAFVKCMEEWMNEYLAGHL